MVVSLAMYVWLMVVLDQDELSYASMKYGAQYVMIIGITMMLEWCANNLDYHIHVRISILAITCIP